MDAPGVAPLVPGEIPLVPSRLERFAVALADGASPTAAYLLAVPRGWVLASRVLRRRAEAWLALSEVRERVAYLRYERLAAADRFLRLWLTGGGKDKRRRRNGA